MSGDVVAAARDAVIRHDAGIPQCPDVDVWEIVRELLEIVDREPVVVE